MLIQIRTHDFKNGSEACRSMCYITCRKTLCQLSWEGSKSEFLILLFCHTVVIHINVYGINIYSNRVDHGYITMP